MRNFILSILIVIFFTACSDNEDVKISFSGYVKTLEVTDITSNSAICKGNVQILAEENAPPVSGSYAHHDFIEESGICYAKENRPTIGDHKVVGKRTSGVATVTNPKIGFFTADMIGLQSSTTYYVRAYIKTSIGVYYGNELSFKSEDEIDDYKVLTSAGIAVQTSDISNYKINWSSANSLCENSILAGFTDWRLPTINELNTIYSNRYIIGGFQTTMQGYYYPLYWSSTQQDYEYLGLCFIDGSTITPSYMSPTYGRCVRSL